jgi:hypothetical protein
MPIKASKSEISEKRPKIETIGSWRPNLPRPAWPEKKHFAANLKIVLDGQAIRCIMYI